LAKREERRAIALAIHKLLQSAANDLERKKNEVQIVCKGKLVKGDSFWVEYQGEKLYIDFIFGTLPALFLAFVYYYMSEDFVLISMQRHLLNHRKILNLEGEEILTQEEKEFLVNDYKFRIFNIKIPSFKF
jgi:hypothetical protein